MVDVMIEMMCSVNFQLQCFGSSSHLKKKFGQGFTILTKIPATGKNEEEYNDEDDGEAAADNKNGSNNDNDDEDEDEGDEDDEDDEDEDEDGEDACEFEADDLSL